MFLLPKNSNIILSKNVSLDPKLKLNNNVLIFNSSPYNVINNYVVPNLLQANSNYVVVDYDNYFFNIFSDFFKSQGYIVKCFNLTDDKSDCWNPFLYFNSDLDISNFLKIVCSDCSEPFFYELELLLLKIIFYYIKDCRSENEHNIKTLFRFINRIQLSEYGFLPFDDLVGKIQSKDLNSNILKMYHDLKSVCTMPVLQSVIINALTDLSSFNYNSMLGNDNIDLTNFNKNKQILFINNKSSKDYNICNALLLNQLLDSLLDSSLGCNVHFIINNMPLINNISLIGIIPDIIKKIVLLSAKNVNFTFGCDNISAFKYYFQDDDFDLFVSLFDNMLMFDKLSDLSISFISKYLACADLKTKKCIDDLPNNKCLVVHNNNLTVDNVFVPNKHRFYSKLIH